MAKKFLIDYKGEEDEYEEPSDVEEPRRFIRKLGKVEIHDPTIERRFEEWADYINNQIEVIQFPGHEHYGMAPQRDDMLFWYLDATLRTGNIAPFRARLSWAYNEDTELDNLVNEEYIVFLDQFRATLNRHAREYLNYYFYNVAHEAFFNAFSETFYKHIEWVYERVFHGIKLLVIDHEYELSDPDNREEFFEAAAEVGRDEWAHETVRQRQIGIGALGYTGYIVDGEHLVDAILRGLALRIVDSPRVIAVLNNNLEVAWHTTAPIILPHLARYLVPGDGNLHLDLGITSIGSYSDSHDWSWNIGDPAEGFAHQLVEEYARAPRAIEPDRDREINRGLEEGRDELQATVREMLNFLTTSQLRDVYDKGIEYVPHVRRQLGDEIELDIPHREVLAEVVRLLDFLNGNQLNHLREFIELVVLMGEIAIDENEEPKNEEPRGIARAERLRDNIQEIIGVFPARAERQVLFNAYDIAMAFIPHVRRHLPQQANVGLEPRIAIGVIRAEFERVLQFLNEEQLDSLFVWLQTELPDED